ncbi:MAG: phenylalanine 4-monooxygenase [Janthinobacterium lividum]
MSLITQDYNAYTAADHTTWALLYKRQTRLVMEQASIEFQRGVNKLILDPHQVPALEDVNHKLKQYSDWQVVAAKGIVPAKEFFLLLQRKIFPVSIDMRSADEVDFSELPDIFHDLYGHVPMLLNKVFSDFMERYCAMALAYADREEFLPYFDRLYWYTMEMGLIREDNLIRPYGAAMLTSSHEIWNMRSPQSTKLAFDIEQVIQADFNPLRLQNTYFIIDSYAQLVQSLDVLNELVAPHGHSSTLQRNNN